MVSLPFSGTPGRDLGQRGYGGHYLRSCDLLVRRRLLRRVGSEIPSPERPLATCTNTTATTAATSSRRSTIGLTAVTAEQPRAARPGPPRRCRPRASEIGRAHV